MVQMNIRANTLAFVQNSAPRVRIRNKPPWVTVQLNMKKPNNTTMKW